MSGGPRAQAGFLPIVPEDLPEGWSSRAPDEGDVDELIALVSAAKKAVDGSGAVESELIAGEAVGEGSWTRRQVVVADPQGVIRVWARVHDRAAGRSAVRRPTSPIAVGVPSHRAAMPSTDSSHAVSTSLWGADRSMSGRVRS